MEKNLQQMQFKDRLCRTLLRINWLIAIVAMLPVLSKIFIGVAAIGMAFYYLILIAVTIITLGLLFCWCALRQLTRLHIREFTFLNINFRTSLPNKQRALQIFFVATREYSTERLYAEV